MMKLLRGALLGFAALVGLSAGASAQTPPPGAISRTQMITTLALCLPTNGVGAITALQVRTCLDIFANSAIFWSDQGSSGVQSFSVAAGTPNTLSLNYGGNSYLMGSFTTGGQWFSWPNEPVSVKSGSYSTQASDRGTMIAQTSASASTLLLTSSAWTTGAWVDVTNFGAGTMTVNTSAGLVNGVSSFSLGTGAGAHIVFDGTNYEAIITGGNGSGGTCTLFSSSVLGCVPASGGSPTNFINAAGSWQSPVGGVCIVDGHQYANFAAALSAGCTSIRIATPQTISTAVTLSTAGLKISCDNNAGFSVAVGNTILVSANGVGINGCTFTGPGKTTTCVTSGSYRCIVFYVAAGSFSFTNNTLTAFGPASQAGPLSHGLIQIAGVNSSGGNSNYIIQNNNITGNGDAGLSIQPGINVQYIYVNNNTLSGFFLDSETGASIADLIVANNHFFAADASNLEQCWTYLGATAFTVSSTFTGNTCDVLGNFGTQTWPSSFGSQENFTITGNTIHLNGFSMPSTGGIMFEFNTMRYGTISGNSYDGVPADGSGVFPPTAGYACESCQYTTISGNLANGFSDNGIGIQVLACSCVSGLITGTSHVTVTGNVIRYTNNTSGYGIEVSTTANQTTGVSLMNNEIYGLGTGAGVGIFVNANGLLTQNIQIGPNTIGNIGLGVQTSNGVTNFCSVSGANYAATNVNYGTSTNACH